MAHFWGSLYQVLPKRVFFKIATDIVKSFLQGKILIEVEEAVNQLPVLYNPNYYESPKERICSTLSQVILERVKNVFNHVVKVRIKPNLQ
jgi:hypothetical protein